MKTELKAKFLQHLSQKKQDQGFTLIELLVVIIIIGILSAIALPSFLNQANKAKQSEAKTYIGSANRAQQAYYLENNGFVSATDNFDLLGLGIPTQTTNYDYAIDGSATEVTHRAKPRVEGGDAGDASVKAYIGAVDVGKQEGTGEATTLAIMCEAIDAPVADGDPGTATITFEDEGPPTCPADTYKTLDG